MIQRVQSLFLAGVAICLGATFFYPIWQKIDINQEAGVILGALGVEVLTPEQASEIVTFPAAIIGILLAAGIIVSVFEIFQYRSRLNQIKLGALNSLILAAVLGLCVFLSFRLEQNFSSGSQGSYEMGMYLPAVALIFNLLANRFIRRDEQLVRSVDRIR